jgi:hypothetical protein
LQPFAIPVPPYNGGNGVEIAFDLTVNSAVSLVPEVSWYNTVIGTASGLASWQNVSGARQGTNVVGNLVLGWATGPAVPLHGVAGFAANFAAGYTTSQALPAGPRIPDPCPQSDSDRDEQSNLYIDPSGTVVSHGVPVLGAKVVLKRSATKRGALVPVPNRSTLMSPSNRRNPDLTDGGGHFGWDVLAGYYSVQATKPRCSGPRRAKSVSTPRLVVPPPRLELVLRLNCPRVQRRATVTTLRSVRLGSGKATGTALTVRVASRRKVRSGPTGTVTFTVLRKRLTRIAVGRTGTVRLLLPARAARRGYRATYSGDGRFAPSQSR